jgi:hypothetical protein
MVLGSTQPLREMSTRKLPSGGGVKSGPRIGLTTLPPSVSRSSRQKCGNLDVSKPYKPSRPVTGTALPYLPHVCITHTPTHLILLDLIIPEPTDEEHNHEAPHYVIFSSLLLCPNSSFIFLLPFNVM